MTRPQTLALYALIQLVSALALLHLPFSPTRASLTGILAALLAWRIHAPWWWILLHGILPLLGWGFLSLALPAIFHFFAFATLALFFGSGSLRYAPLFLSGKSVWEKVTQAIPLHAHVLDAGCGFGSLLRHLHKQRPDLLLTGAELAWLPFCISWICCRNTDIHILHRNFWNLNWAEFDTIFVFLSPEPMPAIWKKFQTETRLGSWLISYHFEIPDHPADWIELDEKGHPIYGWQRT